MMLLVMVARSKVRLMSRLLYSWKLLHFCICKVLLILNQGHRGLLSWRSTKYIYVVLYKQIIHRIKEKSPKCWENSCWNIWSVQVPCLASTLCWVQLLPELSWKRMCSFHLPFILHWNEVLIRETFSCDVRKINTKIIKFSEGKEELCISQKKYSD